MMLIHPALAGHEDQDSERPRYKEGLVTVRMDGFQASLWNPEKLKELETNRPGELFLRNDIIRERYVVEVLQTTRNVPDPDGKLKMQRDYTVELILVDQGGLKVRVPWSVIQRINTYRHELQSEALSAEAAARAAATAAKKAQVC